jgi:dTMP kinase
MKASKSKKPVKKPQTARVKGVFITLEGGEGSGKSSQMKRLGNKLSGLGHHVVMSREPGGSTGAEAVRHVLLSGAAEPFGAEMEAILFAAARADHVDQVIEPALENGSIVISDRFFDSTRAYQGVSGKVDMGLVAQLETIACGSTWPDLTLIFDLSPEEGMKRADNRRNQSDAPDRYEKESMKLQEQRRQAYLEIAAKEKDRCKVIDASGSEEEVFDLVWNAVEKVLETSGIAAGDKKAGKVDVYPISGAGDAPSQGIGDSR